MKLLVVGSVALDSVQTPVAERKDVLGGSASFFSTVASIITPTRLVAVVGDDFPSEHVDFLRERQIDLQGLQIASGRTFRWSGRYLENMVDRQTIDTQLNVFEQFRPELPDSYRDSQVVFLANIDPHLQLQVLKQIPNPKFVACDTMNFWLHGAALQKFKEVLKSVHLIVLNDEEARLLSGQHNLVKAVAAIRLMGVNWVIIKRGDAGAMLYDGEHIFSIPAFPLEHVVDPTGAGDSFAGGFMAYVAHSQDLSPTNLRRAMVVGSAAASFAVEDFSVDRFRTLTRDELLQRCREFGRLVRFEEV